MKANWDKKKTTTENMSSMGLVSDVNKLFPIEKSYTAMGLPEPDVLMEDVEPDQMEQLMQMAKKKKPKKGAEKGHVAVAMDQEAQRPQVKKFRFGPELSKFIVLMIEKHGSDFQRMASDSSNRSQFSAGQIRALIKKFMSIPANRDAYKRAVAESE